MANPLADPDDVAAGWRPLTDAEMSVAVVLITRASAILRAQYPDIDTRMVLGSLDADVVTFVVADMVKTAMIGAAVAGATQESQTVGPYSHSVSYANPTGNLFITAAMDKAIRGYRPQGQSTAYAN